MPRYNIRRNGHEREWFLPNHENCEGTTDIRNRLLRGQGRSFQVIETPRGVLSGEAQVIAIAELVLPEITGIVQFSWEILGNLTTRHL